MNEANVREALLQRPGYTVWREMLKGLEHGKAHDMEEYLLEHLLHLFSERGEATQPVSLLPQGTDVSQLQGAEAQGASLVESVNVPKSFREQFKPLFSKASDAACLHTQVSGMWEGLSGLIVLAFVLSTSGVSYAVIGGWCAPSNGAMNCSQREL